MKHQTSKTENIILVVCFFGIFWFTSRCLATPIAHSNRSSLKTVFVMGPSVSKESFLATIASEPKSVSFVQFREQLSVNHSTTQKLRKTFALAQNALLSEENIDSVPYWRDVVALKFADVYKKSDRDLIVMAHFRVAQLTPFRSEAEQMWRELLTFEPDATPDREYFSTEFHNAFMRIKRQKKNYLTIDVPLDIESVLVFGRSVKIQDGKANLPNATLMLQFLSNQKTPFHWSGNPKDIRIQNFDARKTLVEGSCGIVESAHEEVRKLNRPVVLVASEKCVTPVPLHWTNSVKDLRMAEIAHLAKSTSGNIQSNNVPDFAAPAPIGRATKLLKNKWFYIGLATVAASAIIYTERKKNERASSSDSYEVPDAGSSTSNEPTTTGDSKHADGF